MLYDASWRLLESRIDTDFDPEETSPDFEEHTQLVWGLRYIDDIVSTRRDLNPSEEDGAEVRMFHATDAQFSSVAVLWTSTRLVDTQFGENPRQECSMDKPTKTAKRRDSPPSPPFTQGGSVRPTASPRHPPPQHETARRPHSSRRD